MQNLKGFYTSSKIRSALLMFIATNVVSTQEKEELQKAFKALDKNGDGTLSKEELIEGYMQLNTKDRE
jgi:calcium-dependent protein kinase